MKLFIVIALSFIGSFARSQEINDRREDINTILSTYKILKSELRIPSFVNIEYNNSNAMLSPGELVLLTFSKLNKENFYCKIQLGGELIGQAEFAKVLGYGPEHCLYPDTTENCFVSFLQLDFKKAENQSLLAINSNILPGTLIACTSKEDPNNKFTSLILF